MNLSHRMVWQTRLFLRLNLRKHGLEAGTAKVGAAVSIVHEKGRVRKVILLSVLEQDHFLRRDLSRIFSA